MFNIRPHAEYMETFADILRNSHEFHNWWDKESKKFEEQENKNLEYYAKNYPEEIKKLLCK